MRQNDGFRLDPQAPVLLKDVELVHGIAICIAVSRAAGVRRGDNAKRQATLPLVVHGPQAQLVIAFRNRVIVSELGNMDQVISIHATTA